MSEPERGLLDTSAVNLPRLNMDLLLSGLAISAVGLGDVVEIIPV